MGKRKEIKFLCKDGQTREGLARATTFSNVEALYFVADQAASGKREVNGHA